MDAKKSDPKPNPEPLSKIQPFAGQVRFQSAAPTVVTEPGVGVVQTHWEGEERALADRVLDAGRVYRRAMRDLLQGPYKEFGHLFPSYVRTKSNVFHIFCDDGLVIRYEPASDGERASGRAGRERRSLATVLPDVSDGFVLGARGGTILGSNAPGIEMSQFFFGPDGKPVVFGDRRRVFVVANLDAEQTLAEGRPRPIGSTTSAVVSQVLGELFEEEDGEKGREFLIRSSVRMPVTWDAIEVYPKESFPRWDPEAAPSWAEDDVRAVIASYHIERSKLLTLDPKAEARAQSAAVLAELDGLLDGPEEPVQQFLAKNPRILSPTHTKVWQKLPLGSTITDFVFREAGDRYELVEIERPDRKLFRKDGQQTQELTHAINQTLDWQRYLGDNVRTVREELGLRNIEPHVPRRVVMGRSRDLTPETRRKLALLSVNGLRVVTFDDVIASARAAAEHLLGPLLHVGANSTIYYLPEANEAPKLG